VSWFYEQHGFYPYQERCGGCGLPRLVHPDLTGDAFVPSGQEYVQTGQAPWIFDGGRTRRYIWRVSA
jgi:hypothetical protein